MPDLGAILSYLRANSTSQKVKDTYFEKLCVAFLRQDPRHAAAIQQGLAVCGLGEAERSASDGHRHRHRRGGSRGRRLRRAV
jgi:hypothetical protein